MSVYYCMCLAMPFFYVRLWVDPPSVFRQISCVQLRCCVLGPFLRDVLARLGGSVQWREEKRACYSRRSRYTDVKAVIVGDTIHCDCCEVVVRSRAFFGGGLPITYVSRCCSFASVLPTTLRHE